MSENILEAVNLNYHYPDGTHALKDLNLSIEKGRTTAVLGGNGAGKTTLFLHLNGILKPTSGQVRLEGNPIRYSREGLKELRQKVGIVFQDPDNQLFSASVYQDISFGVMNMKLSKEETKRKVEEAMERTGVSDLKEKPTHCLSFGQKKRVAIAGVLAMEPNVLVLDEPTAGLDPMGVSQIMRLLKDVQQELGISIVIATHDIDIVPLYCDDAYVMERGEVVLHGTPEQIFQSKDELRKVKLRLPRIAHLMEILKEEDGFVFQQEAATISQARKALNLWKQHNRK